MLAPLCQIPFVQVLVDKDKESKPCCAYNGTIGQLTNNSSIIDTINSPVMIDIRNKLKNHELVPELEKELIYIHD